MGRVRSRDLDSFKKVLQSGERQREAHTYYRRDLWLHQSNWQR